MKKKTFALLLSALLACSIMSGCGSNEETNTPAETTETDTTSAAEITEPVVEETEVEESETPEEVVEEIPEGMYRSELTNEWVDESIKNQRPVAIMVDNEVYALDHYGLTQADIVYEMMNSTANGEITRFMAIVKDWGNITRFGSIRSVRPTNFMIAPEYNAVLIHDGGPFYINDYLSNPWIDNLSGGFARIDNGKSREFTEYVTTGEIASRLEANGYSTEYNSYYQGQQWQFADKTTPVDLSAASDSTACSVIKLPFPHNSSTLEYDAESNTYLYSEYGKAHIDPENENARLAFTNVIIQCADCTQLDENGYMKFNIMNAGGEGYYITGGKAIPVTWKKGDAMDATTFYDASGTEITLNTGKTYIALVSSKRWSELVLE